MQAECARTCMVHSVLSRQTEDSTVHMFRMRKVCVSALIVGVLIAGFSVMANARDRGINQPGVVGNSRGVAPGLNQPGAVGNVGSRVIKRDPGLNQSGRIGNVGGAGVDPGLNQPGAVGNVGAPRVDPGLNQPAAAGNRRPR